jgi:hypothetical protein
MTILPETNREERLLADAELDAVTGGGVWAGCIRGVADYLFDHRTGTANDALLGALLRATQR